MDWANRFTVLSSDGTRGSEHKLEHSSYKAEKELYFERDRAHCARLHRVVVESPSCRYSIVFWVLSCVMFCRESDLAEGLD